MPRIDGRTGDIVIRIVYDGMPEAGKTTNIQQLFASIPLQRRGGFASPEAKGRRTEFFDWLDFAGGFVDGRRVRCQLVSVPGQPQLLHRRKYLLESADVVVFVADSQPARMDDNRAAFTELVRMLAALDSDVDVATVVQANKQDLADSLRPRSLASAIEVPLGTPIVPAVAQAGRGVMDTFVLAARLATDRVRALMIDGDDLDELATADTSPDTLHAAMIDLERRTSAPTSAPRLTHDALRSLTRSRENAVDAARGCEIPRAETLLAGHVWPPVKGRASAAAAGAGALEIPESVAAWAPAGAIEVASDAGWLLHSSAAWRFGTEGQARAELMALVRKLLPLPELMLEGRAVLVAPDGDAYRLWIVTPDVASLADEILDAIAGRDSKRVLAALDGASTAAAALADARGSGAAEAGSAGVALRGGRVALLSVPCGGEDAAVDEHAVALAHRATEGDAEGRTWVEKWTSGRRMPRPSGSGG
jgi:signal recognition particle receptor subunit beta